MGVWVFVLGRWQIRIVFCWLVSYFGWRHLPDALNQIHTSTHTHARHGKSICAHIPATRNTHGASPKRFSHITNIKNKCNGSPKNLFFFLVCHTYAYSQLSLHPHKTKKNTRSLVVVPILCCKHTFLGVGIRCRHHTTHFFCLPFPCPARGNPFSTSTQQTHTDTHSRRSELRIFDATHTHTHTSKQNDVVVVIALLLLQFSNDDDMYETDERIDFDMNANIFGRLPRTKKLHTHTHTNYFHSIMLATHTHTHSILSQMNSVCVCFLFLLLQGGLGRTTNYLPAVAR